MGGIALMWRGGCIIRSRFLGKIKEAFDKNPNLDNLLLDSFFSGALNKYQASWRKALVHAVELGVPTPAFSTALAFFDGYRTARLPANLLQAQRDFFGAHTYERVDQPRGQFFHTNWTGSPGPGRSPCEFRRQMRHSKADWWRNRSRCRRFRGATRREPQVPRPGFGFLGHSLSPFHRQFW
jgi:hypothetical protein